MKKTLIVLLSAFIIVINLGSGLALPVSASNAQGQGEKIEFSEWGASIQLPSNKWSPIGEFFNQQANKSIFSYRREKLMDKSGLAVMANISFIFEKVPHIDVYTYSAQLQLQVPIDIKTKFTSTSGLMSLKNAVGYIGTSVDQDGIEHTIILIHALNSGKGMQVIMDITSELYPQIQGEFKKALKSLRFK